MRHIPEAELHAYLDQALSRTQCVEIERHLAACAACQLARDESAALRDRTTALLASLAPATTHVPPFEIVRSRTAGALSAQRRRRQRIVWAASVLGGIGLGWTAAMVFRAGHTATVASTDMPGTAVAPANPARTTSAPAPSVAPRSGSTATASATRQQRISKASDSAMATGPAAAPTVPSRQDLAAAPAGRNSVLTPSAAGPSGPIASLPTSPDRAGGATDSAHPAGNLVMSGAWQTVSWAGAQAQAGGKAPPHIDGLPVVEVQVQKNEPGERPTMVVAQQLASGEVIRTIEGPAADVSRLLGRRTMTDPVPDSTRSASAPAAGGAQGGVGQSMALQRGDRMVAITGALSPDSLRAMMLRLHGGQVEQEPGAAPTAPNVPVNGPARPNLPLTPPPQR